MLDAELVEVAPGRWRAADCCTAVDLEAAQQLAVEADRLREDAAAMLAVAAERGVLVPDELRERLSLGARGLPATRRLRDELAAIVRPTP
jgi:predicted deacylase